MTLLLLLLSSSLSSSLPPQPQFHVCCLECFDTSCWASERASGLNNNVATAILKDFHTKTSEDTA